MIAAAQNGSSIKSPQHSEKKSERKCNASNSSDKKSNKKHMETPEDVEMLSEEKPSKRAKISHNQ